MSVLSTSVTTPGAYPLWEIFTATRVFSSLLCLSLRDVIRKSVSWTSVAFRATIISILGDDSHSANWLLTYQPANEQPQPQSDCI